MSEMTHYQDTRVLVTNSRVMFDDKTYALSNITSVSLTQQTPNRLWPIAMILIGGAFICTGGLMLIFGENCGLGTLGFGVFLAGFGFLWNWALHTEYRVTIGSASGEIHALSSPKREYIQEIVNAINTAIIQRG